MKNFKISLITLKHKHYTMQILIISLRLFIRLVLLFCTFKKNCIWVFVFSPRHVCKGLAMGVSLV